MFLNSIHYSLCHSDNCFFLLFSSKDFYFFITVSRLQQYQEEGRKISHLPTLSPHMHALEHFIRISHQNGAYVNSWGTCLENRNHPKLIVYIRLYFWYCTFCGFGQMYNEWCVSIIMESNKLICTTLKILCALYRYLGMKLRSGPFTYYFW